jgi:predicted PurR-regulated permease PerM
MLTGDLFVAPAIDWLEKRLGPSTAAGIVVLSVLAVVAVVALASFINCLTV